MKIVITGALGHIGSRLIREYPTCYPHSEIILIDNLSTQRYGSLFNLPKKARFQFIEANVEQMDLIPVFQDCDLVIHLAAITNAEGSFEMRERVERVNFEGTKRVAMACLQTRTPLLFPSSTSVYGTAKNIVNEDCEPSDLNPQSPYAETKLREEQLILSLSQKGLRFTICRFGTIFGTSVGMRFHTAVNKFCWQAVNGEPVTVWTTALHQVRPYLDLSDAVRALLFLIQTTRYDQNIYNVLTTNASVHHILESIKLHIPNIGVKFVDTKIMNQLSYHVSNEKFKALGFTFNGSLETGIRETIDLLRYNSLKAA